MHPRQCLGHRADAGDVAAIVSPDLDVVVLPKVESPRDLQRLDAAIVAAMPGEQGPRVLALIETCAGILAAAEIARASPRLAGLVFGAGDLGKDLGLPTLRGDISGALAWGRAKLVYDARAAGLPGPIDGPCLAVRDQAAMAAEARAAAALGYRGKVCIHPDQVAIANRAFSPDADEVAFARKVIAAFTEAEARGSASITVDGVFVDYPIVDKAQALVRLAEQSGAASMAVEGTERMGADGSAATVLPMQGVRVLDCATFIAGPTCATMLGEFGADVIKVELPGIGCPLRKFGTITPSGDSLLWLSEGRNKRSLTLDLRKPEGVAVMKDLVAQSDVVVENFQPGTLERWGVGYDTLAAINPKLVMVRISAYGQTGPYRDRPGFGRIANAFGGISFLAGYPDRPPVTPGSATLPDYMSGLYGALGALFALRVVERTGRGQVVDIGLYEVDLSHPG